MPSSRKATYTSASGTVLAVLLAGMFLLQTSICHIPFLPSDLSSDGTIKSAFSESQLAAVWRLEFFDYNGGGEAGASALG